MCVDGSPGMVLRVNWMQLPQIQFDDTTLEISTNVKNLGIYIDIDILEPTGTRSQM